MGKKRIIYYNILLSFIVENPSFFIKILNTFFKTLNIFKNFGKIRYKYIRNKNVMEL